MTDQREAVARAIYEAEAAADQNPASWRPWGDISPSEQSPWMMKADAATAALRPEAQGVKIKPLEWVTVDTRMLFQHYKAATPVGKYRVYQTPYGYKALNPEGEELCHVEHDTVSNDSAFEAAQKIVKADCEARILSALDRPEAQDGVASAAKVLLAEHERCSAIPIGKRTHAEQCAAQMGKNRLRALSQGGK